MMPRHLTISLVLGDGLVAIAMRTASYSVSSWWVSENSTDLVVNHLVAMSITYTLPTIGNIVVLHFLSKVLSELFFQET